MAALEELVNAELVLRRGTPPHATYIFKHALVEDAAYASLLKGKQQQLHAAIAREGRGRVARPFGFALTDPGRRFSRTRLFPEVTRVEPLGVSRGV